LLLFNRISKVARAQDCLFPFIGIFPPFEPSVPVLFLLPHFKGAFPWAQENNLPVFHCQDSFLAESTLFFARFFSDLTPDVSKILRPISIISRRTLCRVSTVFGFCFRLRVHHASFPLLFHSCRGFAVFVGIFRLCSNENSLRKVSMSTLGHPRQSSATHFSSSRSRIFCRKIEFVDERKRSDPELRTTPLGLTLASFFWSRDFPPPISFFETRL